MSLVKLNNQEEFEAISKKASRFLFLKNSTTCPISRQAFGEYEKYAESQDVPLYYLNVQEARELSNWIAASYGVKHESPQALLFENNEVTWNDSHYNITYDALNKQWA